MMSKQYQQDDTNNGHSTDQPRQPQPVDFGHFFDQRSQQQPQPGPGITSSTGPPSEAHVTTDKNSIKDDHMMHVGISHVNDDNNDDNNNSSEEDQVSVSVVITVCTIYCVKYPKNVFRSILNLSTELLSNFLEISVFNITLGYA